MRNYKMSEEFETWAFGVILFLIFTLILYFLGKVILLDSHYSFLECWGLIMMFVVIKSGIDTWNQTE